MPRTSAGPQALHLPLGGGKQHRGSPVAQKLSPDFRPRYCGAGVSHVLGPSTIELCTLFVGEREFSLALHVGKAFPKSHRKFSTIAGRKFQELGKRAGFHGVILSRGVSCRNRFGSYGTCGADRPLAWPSRIAGLIRLLVQRSNVPFQPRRRMTGRAAVGCKRRLAGPVYRRSSSPIASPLSPATEYSKYLLPSSRKIPGSRS